MISVFLLYALVGFSFILAKLAATHMYPFFGVGVRMLSGGLLLFLFIFIRHRISCYPTRKDLKYYVRLAVISMFLGYSLRLWSQQYLTSIKASLLFTLSPFITALLSYILMREKLTKLKITGLLIGFVGMMPTLIARAPQEGFNYFGFLSLGELAFIGSIACASYGLITLQKLVRYRKCPPYLANATSMTLGGMMALGTSCVTGTGFIKTGTIGTIVLILLGQVLISNVVCSNLRAYLLKTYSPTFISFAGFLTPLFTSLYGWIIFKETPSWAFVLSFVMLIIGLGIYYYDDTRRSRYKKQRLVDTAP